MRRLVALFLVLSVMAFSKTIHVTADYAVPTEDVIEYVGNVHALIEEEKIELWSGELKITKIRGDWNLIEASKTVHVKMEDMESTSNRLVYEMDTKKGKMYQNVVVHVEDEQTTIKSDFLDFDRNSEIYEGSSTSLSVIVRKDVTIKGKSFKFDRKNSKLTVQGSFQAFKVEEKEGEKKEMKVFGERADIDTSKDEMKVTGNVKIEYGEIKASCDEMEFDMKAKGKLRGNVKTLVKAKKENEKDIHIESDQLDFDTDQDIYKGYSYGDKKVKIVRGKTTVYARWFEYDRKEGKVYLHQDVVIDSKDKNVRIHASQAIIYTETEKMELWNVKMEIKR